MVAFLCSWLYRIRPSVQHPPYSKYPTKTTIDWSANHPNPSQMLFKPFDIPDATKGAVDFVDGLNTFSGAGDPKTRHGMAIHIYGCNTSMKDKAMFNADGDFMIAVASMFASACGWVDFFFSYYKRNIVAIQSLELAFYNTLSAPCCFFFFPFLCLHVLPPGQYAPVAGANGLANPRDFKTPTAWFEDRKGSNFTLVNKYQGFFFHTFMVRSYAVPSIRRHFYSRNTQEVIHSNLTHADSSIFTMLTCPAANSGKALVNVTVFRPRWSVADHTFRPPFYHSKKTAQVKIVMGLPRSLFQEKRFQPGGATFHGIMAPHGMDAETYEYNRTVELVPTRIEEGSLAFMIEGLLNMTVTKWAEHDCGKLDPDYYKEWQDIATNFNPNWEPPKEH
ncbi:homogentisate 1,2-dioxygenase, putative [Ixodes scapularis]|uniref:Homogentisate 1,2-dioxygenase n=1 Tax=Ixodes scapularis TaxID=6945 RepID=B7PK05_IXOSC|nr:homogentisate 1,2-dioxygenase, putative [Ixodes scapularis]|eukprot:XP_002409026.1 homogentisate 1,2-dioxygenase, putative [Ixodes scapularis]